jgi:hypothetical protein
MQSAGIIVRAWDPLRMRGDTSVLDPGSPKTNEEIEAEERQKFFPEVKPKYEKFAVSEVQLVQDGSYVGNRVGKATLVIKKFKREMQGNFTCEVHLQYGSHTSKSFNLVLAELTHPIILYSDPVSKELTIYEGMDNDIECEVYSIPNATITWRLDGEDLTEGYSQEPL